ncbi:MAG: PQQ-binding-like beta-propeller repeat protein [Planctomycetes bacterium]|nr:PQQ-binding-like beta-propeller repeat protein [Planctomycetota bacterium]MCP4770486.1 PQQ-binding-like beta-propeller repeat protein [Planctomycetota bacterium]MCP4859926.1 PQQ-binding-like beta-propeller repeat protein [Planctomycetota bacterium]
MRRFIILLLLAALPAQAYAQQWPGFRGDSRRSGATAEQLQITKLIPHWTWKSSALPQPAWPGPARWDAWAGLEGLRSMRNYDPVFHPVAVGDAVYLASNADDSLRCLDAANGSLRWTFTADGPIRIAPSVVDGRIYFGSDDGAAYCLDASSGEQLWRVHPTEGERLVIQDGRLISFWPIRTGVVVEDGKAYFGASMLPWKDSFLFAVDAKTGRKIYTKNLGQGWTLEGALLVSKRSLVLPQGRISPLMFDRKTGEPQGSLEGGGGSFVLLTEDEQVLHGPGNKDGWITASERDSREVVASYAKGNAVVVSGKTAFLLSDRAVTAMDREEGGLLWTMPANTPFELIQAGNTLFLGGDGFVEARQTTDGKLLWRAAVNGKAWGLAVANQQLLVSTDQGELTVFHAGKEEIPLASEEVNLGTAVTHLGPARAVHQVPKRDLLDHWTFQADSLTDVRVTDNPEDPRTKQVMRNQARGRQAAQPNGRVQLEDVGAFHAYVFDGVANDLTVSTELKDAKLPKKAMTAAAWVRIDQAQSWGGIIGAAQDNGEYERGWLLGFREKRFGFVVTGKDKDERATWLLSESSFVPGAWHHVAASYDGKLTRIWVDGKLEAEGKSESGPILYPEHAIYQIGAYRDDDEHFRIKGMVHEVAVWGRALKTKEVEEQYAQLHEQLPAPVVITQSVPTTEPTGLALAAGPFVRFPFTGTARIQWHSHESAETVLEWKKEGESTWNPVVVAGSRLVHEVTLQDLPHLELLHFRVRASQEEDSLATPAWELDTHFDYNLATLNVEAAAASARFQEGQTLRAEQLPETQGGAGIVVLLGAGTDLDFAKGLIAQSGLRLLLVSTTPERTASLRADLLLDQGYGTRISILPVDSFDSYPLPSCFANLVVADPTQSPLGNKAMAEARRIVKPDGGVFAMFGAKEHRAALAGASGWTHMYGRADNSAFNGESLSGTRTIDDLEVQWLGRPGARYQTDRQNRRPAPLAEAGMLYLQGKGRVIAMDAFNGQVCWDLEMPNFARFNIPHDCSNWCADSDSLFLATQGQLHEFESRTGKNLRVLDVLPNPDQSFEWDWGFTACVDDIILGTPVRAGSSFTNWWTSEAWFDSTSGEATKKVCGDGIFALKRDSGAKAWERHQGLIIHSTITIADGAVTFLENRNAELISTNERRVGSDLLWQDLYMVSLDLQTGNLLWEREAKPLPGNVVIFMAQSEGKLVLASSNAGEFGVYVFDAKDGSSVWRKKIAWEVDHHGKALSRPLIVNGNIYLRPAVLALKDGKIVDQPFPKGHQCGTYVATTEALILRAGELAIWDQQKGGATRWNRLRPDCWISTIPANGMLLSPEGGGGCSCGNWLQTSLGFLPKAAQ